MISRKTILASTALGFVLFSSPAYAYLDPGTGSMLLQLALGGVAGFLVILKLYWSRFVGLFHRSGAADELVQDNDK